MNNERPRAISYVTSTGRLVTQFTCNENLLQRIFKSQIVRSNVYVDGIEFNKRQQKVN